MIFQRGTTLFAQRFDLARLALVGDPSPVADHVLIDAWSVWAVGCVLYEMLTGRPAFEGEDVPEILSRVLQREPDWNRLPAGTPAGIRQLLRRCLQKNRMRRLHAADTRIEMEEAQDGAEADGHVAQAPARRSKLWVGIAAISSLTAIAFATLWAVSFNWPEPPEIRVEVNTPSTADPISFAISPDGRRLVFSASNEGQSAALRR